jgi:hypothetical protein
LSGIVIERSPVHHSAFEVAETWEVLCHLSLLDQLRYAL